jgi:hypothetical protein
MGRVKLVGGVIDASIIHVKVKQKNCKKSHNGRLDSQKKSDIDHIYRANYPGIKITRPCAFRRDLHAFSSFAITPVK